jgi:hAT family C-terminal dimerisation region
LKDLLRGKKSSEQVKLEFEEYLNEPLDDTSLDEEFDILSWWKLKALRFPTLAHLTGDILAVSISTVASKSAFSTSDITLSPARNSLNDESIETLICAQDWLRASITGMFIYTIIIAIIVLRLNIMIKYCVYLQI